MTLSFIDSPTQVTSSPATSLGQRRSRVAFDGANTYLAVWEEGAWVWQSSVPQIYAARLYGSGTAQLIALDAGGIHLLSDSYAQEYPKVVSDSNGTFLVVWQQFNGTDYDVKGVRVNSSGTILDASGISISGSQFYNQALPDVCYDAVNQRFVVVWCDLRSFQSDLTKTYQIYWATVDPSTAVVTQKGLLYDKGDHSSGYSYAIYNPSIQCTSTSMLLTFSERSRYVDFVGGANDPRAGWSIAKAFDLNGVWLHNTPTYPEYNSTAMGCNKGYDCPNDSNHQAQPNDYPENGSTAGISAILANGTNFLWLINNVRNARLGQTIPHFSILPAYVSGAGYMPNALLNLDTNNYTHGLAGFWANPYYYVFWESLPSSPDAWNNQSFGGVHHQIYCGRVNETGTLLPDTTPILISSDPNSVQMNPCACKGAGAEGIVIYEEDSLISDTSLWLLKARSDWNCGKRFCSALCGPWSARS